MCGCEMQFHWNAMIDQGRNVMRHLIIGVSNVMQHMSICLKWAWNPRILTRIVVAAVLVVVAWFVEWWLVGGASYQKFFNHKNIAALPAEQLALQFGQNTKYNTSISDQRQFGQNTQYNTTIFDQRQFKVWPKYTIQNSSLTQYNWAKIHKQKIISSHYKLIKIKKSKNDFWPTDTNTAMISKKKRSKGFVLFSKLVNNKIVWKFSSRCETGQLAICSSWKQNRPQLFFLLLQPMTQNWSWAHVHIQSFDICG